jgi:TP901 family phage tail tape measure protein
MALERSGSAFASTAMGAREAMAAIAAVSTVTGKTGSTIGDSWKSILANLDFKKAQAALEAYNIQLYEVGKNGEQVQRQGAVVLKEILQQYAQLDDQAQKQLATAIAGGKYQVNNMQAFLRDSSQSFLTFLKEMEEKSSDATTETLLQASMKTYQTELAQAKASFEVLGITIGEMVLPYLKDFGGIVATLCGVFGVATTAMRCTRCATMGYGSSVYCFGVVLYLSRRSIVCYLGRPDKDLLYVLLRSTLHFICASHTRYLLC